MYVFMYECTHVWCMFAHLYVRCKNVRMYACMYVRTHERTFICMYMRIYLCWYVFKCVSIYECLNMCVYVCIHALTHMWINVHSTNQGLVQSPQGRRFHRLGPWLNPHLCLSHPCLTCLCTRASAWISKWASGWVSERVIERVGERGQEWVEDRVSKRVSEWVSEWLRE